MSSVPRSRLPHTPTRFPKYLSGCLPSEFPSARKRCSGESCGRASWPRLAIVVRSRCLRRISTRPKKSEARHIDVDSIRVASVGIGTIPIPDASHFPSQTISPVAESTRRAVECGTGSPSDTDSATTATSQGDATTPVCRDATRNTLTQALKRKRSILLGRSNVVFSCELAWRGPCASTGRDKIDRQLKDFLVSLGPVVLRVHLHLGQACVVVRKLLEVSQSNLPVTSKSSLVTSVSGS